MGPLTAAKATLDRWKARPISMVREQFGVEPDAWQAEALAAFGNPDIERIAMKACKGPGKTCVIAWMILNFLATRLHCRIGATSITESNLQNSLWPELAFWMAKSPFFSQAFVWSKTTVVNRENPESWFCAARSWPKSADATQQALSLAGLHADHVAFFVDESSGIPQAVMTTIEAIFASGREAKLVQAGNPTHTTGPLHRACTKDRSLWHVITITGDPDDPQRSPRINLDWARQQIQSYGRESPWVMCNVLGLFPPTSLNALLGADDVEQAMHRHLPVTSYEHAQKRLGIDTARYGGDLTVLFPRQGLAAFHPRAMRHLRGSAVSVDIATAVMAAKRLWGSELELFDGTGGWSAGAVDVLRAGGVDPIDVQFHSKALDPRYKNRRAEMYFLLAKWVTGGGALPNIPELVEELTEQTYTFVNGQFQLEDKDLVRDRLGRSPNYADALALTFGLPEMPNAAMQQLRGRQTARHEFDPFANREDGTGTADYEFDPLQVSR
jgi:phage terminase large subunit